MYTFQFQLLLTNKEVRLWGKSNLPELCQYGQRLNYCYFTRTFGDLPKVTVRKLQGNTLELKRSGPQAGHPTSILENLSAIAALLYSYAHVFF